MANLLISGRPISPGFALGHAAIWGQGETHVPSHDLRAEEAGNEVDRFREALEKSPTELQRLSERVKSELGSALFCTRGGGSVSYPG